MYGFRVSIALLVVLAWAVASSPIGAEGAAAPAPTATDTAPPAAAAGSELAPEPPSPTPAALATEPPVGGGGADPGAEIESAPTFAPGPVLHPDVAARIREIESVVAAVRRGETEPAVADALYPAVESDLKSLRRAVRRAALEGGGEDLDGLRALYDARLGLLQALSPELRARVLGGGSLGMRAFQGELSYVLLNLGLTVQALPDTARSLATGATDSPFDDLWRFGQLVLVLLVFRGWRRWAVQGIPDARSHVLGIQPRQPIHSRTARALWYVERLRNPVEWLALWWAIWQIFDPRHETELPTLLWIVLVWLLVARFAVQLIDAWVARDFGGLKSGESGLRLRSLRLVARWLLVLGLGLDLANRYAGAGTIHAWLMRAFQILTLPVVGVLLHWWRDEIFRRLEEEGHYSPWARRMAARKRGFGSYLNVALGAAYLTGLRFLQAGIRSASGFDLGRRGVAILLRREVERDSLREPQDDEEPIAPELAARLLNGKEADFLVESAASDALARLVEVASSEHGGTIAILSERGGGGRTLLGRLNAEIGDVMRTVSCPPGGFNRFRAALAEELGIESDDVDSGLRARLDSLGVRVIAIDNVHRLARPKMGGQRGLEELANLTESAGEGVLWLYLFDRYAWLYISLARGDRSMLHEAIELPEWTEGEIGELIAGRAEAAGIALSYRHLVLPRQLDEGGDLSYEERNRAGFARILWELSSGNPESAARLFVGSLREKRGELIVRLPQPPPSEEVTDANFTTQLVLRVILQCDPASAEDIWTSLRISPATVKGALRYCQQHGWIEPVQRRYRITDLWYRTISRVLVRQSLLPR